MRIMLCRADSSPERSVSVAEPGGVAAVCDGGGPGECPPELYNLTQLAEVSLAAAAGHLFSHHVLHSETARGYGEVRPPEEGTEVQAYATSFRYPAVVSAEVISSYKLRIK
jgi:hypothetical protein